jgi:hypothetical protein
MTKMFRLQSLLCFLTVRKTPFLVQSLFRKFVLLLWGWKFTSARDHKQMLTLRGVQFVDCISKINHIFKYFGVFCFLKTQKTLHPYWISDFTRYPFKYLSYRSLSIAFSVFFFTHSWHSFQYPPPEFACMCLITRTAWVLRQLCGFCARFAIDVNMEIHIG